MFLGITQYDLLTGECLSLSFVIPGGFKVGSQRNTELMMQLYLENVSFYFYIFQMWLCMCACGCVCMCVCDQCKAVNILR